MTLLFSKVSILLFYKRLFGVQKYFRWALYITMAFVVAYCGICSLAVIFKCYPMAASWSTKPHPDAHCLNMTVLHNVIGAFNVVSDVLILLLPFPILWRLQMPLAKKLGTSAIIATGSLCIILFCEAVSYQRKLTRVYSVCVAAIIRWVLISLNSNSTDLLWHMRKQIAWS